MKRLLCLCAALCGAVAVATSFSAASVNGQSVVLVDKVFNCANYAQPLDLELVKVTLTPAYAGVLDDAINLNRKECTGRIGRIEVDTSVGDGVKLGETANDLSVESGYVLCRGHKPGKHQDGVQALGGLRVTFSNLHVYCPTSNNASFYMTAGAGAADVPTEGDWPTDIVCENCQLEGGMQTVFLAKSIRSGVRDSLIRMGKYRAFRVGDEAVSPVLVNNVELPCRVNCE